MQPYLYGYVAPPWGPVSAQIVCVARKSEPPDVTGADITVIWSVICAGICVFATIQLNR